MYVIKYSTIIHTCTASLGKNSVIPKYPFIHLHRYLPRRFKTEVKFILVANCTDLNSYAVDQYTGKWWVYYQLIDWLIDWKFGV